MFQKLYITYIAFRLNDAWLARCASYYMSWFSFTLLSLLATLIDLVLRAPWLIVHICFLRVYGERTEPILKQVTIVDEVV